MMRPSSSPHQHPRQRTGWQGPQTRGDIPMITRPTSQLQSKAWSRDGIRCVSLVSEQRDK